MKKNKMMRLASALLVAVLLTTSIISGTFAKYVTSDSVKDEARVAKFGVVVAGSGSLFAKSYYAADENTPGEKAKDGKDWEELTVETSNGDKLVAPGTKNEDGMTIAVTGIPEVDVRVTLDVSDVVDVFLASANDLPDMTTGKDKYFSFDDVEDYYPIVFTLAGTFVENNWKAIKEAASEDLTLNKADSEVSGKLEDIVALLEDVFAGDDGDGIYVDANTDLSEAIGTFTLTWEWVFEADGNNKAVKLQDQKDTLLGDLAAARDGEFDTENLVPEAKLEAFEALVEGEDYCLDVALKLAVTVTQVD